MVVGGGITYRSLSGDDYPAAIVALHADGRVDIEVDGLSLHGIKHRDNAASCGSGECYGLAEPLAHAPKAGQRQSGSGRSV